MVEKIANVFIGLLLCVSSYTDLKYGKIKNNYVLAGFIGSVILVLIRDGPKGIMAGSKAMIIVFLLFMVVYVLGGLGGGDIKLFCILAMMYPHIIFQVIVASFFIGAVFSILKMIGRFFAQKKIYIKGETIPFSICILFATILVGINPFHVVELLVPKGGG